MKKCLFLISMLVTCAVMAQSKVSYFYDIEESQDFDSIKNQNFQSLEDTNHGLANGTYWFKIEQIENTREMLTIPSNHANVFELRDSNGNEIYRMADTRYPSFFLIDRIHEFPIYLRGSFKQEAYFPVDLLEESEYISTEKRYLLGSGVFYGAIVSLIFATMMFYFITRNRIFLFHSLLAGVVAYTIIAKDNLWYLFNSEFEELVYIELFSHFLVGFFGFCFAFYYLKLKHNAKLQKTILISLVACSAIFMMTYVVTNDMIFYFISDLFTVATITAVWVIGMIKTKNKTINWFIGLIYLYNIYLMLEVFVLHSTGGSLLGFSTFAAKVCVFIDIMLITFAMMYTFKKLQVEGSLMKQQIKTYLQRIATLDQYKKVQDADDSYLETLINEFALSNLEVKVLQGISKGHTNEHIASDYQLTDDDIERTTKSLYNKLGIEGDQEIRMLVS